MCDAVIDGRVVEFKTVNWTIQNNVQAEDRLRRMSNAAVRGKFEVSGTLVPYFQNEALLASFFAKPHKAAAWASIRPHLYRTVAYAGLLAGTFLFFVTGAR